MMNAMPMPNGGNPMMPNMNPMMGSAMMNPMMGNMPMSGMPMMGGMMNPMMGGMMNPMMGGMMNPMMNPMMMPMMGMPMMMPMMGMGMMPMMCKMTCEMGKDGMVCKMTPMDASQLDMMKDRMNQMTNMMNMGVPCMMMCGGMPMMMCTM
jgi:hypothetical protein